MQTGVVVGAAIVAWLILDRIGRRLVGRIVDRHADRADVQGEERAQRIRTLWSLGRAVLLVTLLVIVVLVIMGIWGIPTTPFVAVGSVIGVALGFGAQDLVRDIIAGLFVIAEDQYAIDDFVEIADVSGRVEAIRLRTTVLRDLDGNVHYVPNGQVTVASNLTQEFSQVVVDVGVAYETDVDRALAVVNDEVGSFAQDEAWAEGFLAEPEILGVESLSDSAVVLRVVFKVKPRFRWTVRREFLRRIKKRFDADGIEIPYQKLTVVQQRPPEPSQ